MFARGAGNPDPPLRGHYTNKYNPKQLGPIHNQDFSSMKGSSSSSSSVRKTPKVRMQKKGESSRILRPVEDAIAKGVTRLRTTRDLLHHLVKKIVATSPAPLGYSKVELVGSTSWSGEVPQSDVDLVLIAPQHNFDSSGKSFVDAEKLPDRQFLKSRAVDLLGRLQQAIEDVLTCNQSTHLWKVELLNDARVPVLQIFDSSGIKSDITVDQGLVSRSSAHRDFMQSCLKDNELALRLIRLVKYWLRSRGLPTAAEGGIPSFAWTVVALRIVESSKQPGVTIERLIRKFFEQLAPLTSECLRVHAAGPNAGFHWQPQQMPWAQEWVSWLWVEDPTQPGTGLTPPSIPAALCLLYVAEIQRALNQVRSCTSNSWERLWKPVVGGPIKENSFQLVLRNGMLQLGQIHHVRRCPSARREGLHRWDQSSELVLNPSHLQIEGSYIRVCTDVGPRIVMHPCHWVCSLPTQGDTGILLPGDGYERLEHLRQLQVDMSAISAQSGSSAQRADCSYQVRTPWKGTQLSDAKIKDRTESHKDADQTEVEKTMAGDNPQEPDAQGNEFQTSIGPVIGHGDQQPESQSTTPRFHLPESTTEFEASTGSLASLGAKCNALQGTMNDVTGQCLAAKYLSADRIAMQFLHYSDSEPPSHYSDSEKSIKSTAENSVTGSVQLVNEDDDLQTIWNFAQRSKFYSEDLPAGSQTPELSQVEASTDCGTTEIDHISDGGDRELDDPLIQSLVHSVSCFPEVWSSPMGGVTSESFLDQMYADDAQLEMAGHDQITPRSNADSVHFNPDICWDVKENVTIMPAGCPQNEEPTEHRSAPDCENRGTLAAPVYTDGGSTFEISQDLCATAEPEDRELLSTSDLPKDTKIQKTSKQPSNVDKKRPQQEQPEDFDIPEVQGYLPVASKQLGRTWKPSLRQVLTASPALESEEQMDANSEGARPTSPLRKERGATSFRSVTEDTSSSLAATSWTALVASPQVANEKQNPLNPKQPIGKIDVQKMSIETHLESSKPHQQAAWVPSLWARRHN